MGVEQRIERRPRHRLGPRVAHQVVRLVVAQEDAVELEGEQRNAGLPTQFARRDGFARETDEEVRPPALRLGQDVARHGRSVVELRREADEWAAGGQALGDALTSEFTISFVRPAVGETLVARGRVLHAGTIQATAEACVFAARRGEERLVAVALGSVVRART